MLQKTTILFFLVLLTTVLSIGSCVSSQKGQNTYVGMVNCRTETTYEIDIKPIMTAQCIKCHNAYKNSDGVSLDTYEGTKESFEIGKGLCTVFHDCSPMPRNAPKLTAEQLETLTCWVKSGFKK